MINHKETQYGFEWGSASISRFFSDTKKGWVTIGIETPKYKGHNNIQIYVTKTGKVRVHSKDGEWRLSKVQPKI